ncbi:MAG TPA: AMP-binding protein [Albidovulum sp.]|uniref:AMP-binding protein n=1 Tax=Albidovulum sp. TaxID=1872424 RepID=UPI002B824E25|nr:AMP-binding protein [Albidovulum sp.]
MYDTNTLAAALRAASLGRDQAVFARDAQDRVLRSYAMLWANAEKTASALVAAGLQPGDRVAVQAPKTLEMLELYLGTILAGGVFLPLNPAYTGPEIGYFLADAAPRIFVVDPAGMAAVAPHVGGVAEVWTLDAAGRGTLMERRDAAPGFAGAVTRAETDLAAILYTSGTTGRSKGAMLSHRALLSNAATLAQVWEFSDRDVLIHALPIFHTHGLFVATNVTLLAGGSLIFLPKFDAGAILATLSRATVLMGVPTFYSRLLEEPALAEAGKSVRLFISGSAPLLAETHDRWSAVTGHAIVERYGMTETNMNTSNPVGAARKAGTVGKPLPGVEVIVTDPGSGQTLPAGEVGMIEVRGPNLFSGYWQMPEKTAEELRANGFLITGDLGCYDADGYLSIVGRSKDLIISGGFNIYPKEIELLIDEVEGVAESAVVGVPHPDLGEAVLAVIVTKPGSAITARDVVAALQGKLARFKQPREVVMVEELPRNAMGKVQKAELRKTYAGLFAPKSMSKEPG